MVSAQLLTEISIENPGIALERCLVFLLLAVFGTVKCAFADEVAARVCADKVLPHAEVTLDVHFGGDHFEVEIDGEWWGIAHSTGTMVFADESYHIGLRTFPLMELAELFGPIELLLISHRGTAFALRSERGVYLGAGGFVDGRTTCVGDWVIQGEPL